jgi:hypothetical protein
VPVCSSGARWPKLLLACSVAPSGSQNKRGAGSTTYWVAIASYRSKPATATRPSEGSTSERGATRFSVGSRFSVSRLLMGARGHGNPRKAAGVGWPVLISGCYLSPPYLALPSCYQLPSTPHISNWPYTHTHYALRTTHALRPLPLLELVLALGLVTG